MDKTQEFLNEYGKLREKYNHDFISVPVFLPNEKGTFELTVQTYPVDLATRIKASDFIPKK